MPENIPNRLLKSPLRPWGMAALIPVLLHGRELHRVVADESYDGTDSSAAVISDLSGYLYGAAITACILGPPLVI